MDPRAGHDENRLYDYLLDTGVLDDVKSVAESVVGSASVSSTSAADDADADADDEARRIADRLLERNADDVDRALDAIVRDLRLAEPGQLVDYRWPGLVDLRAGQPPRKTLRNLNALLRLPFTYDTYTGAYFRRLTEGLERTFAADAFFRATVLVYAKLVDAAPDLEGAVESFGSLCVAARHRCLRSRDYGKSVTSVCLLTRCLRAVCKRGAGSKNVKPAVVEFVATVSGDAGERHGPYAILCCADPTARWFDRVSKCYSSRSAFFECLHGDGRLLKAVVSSFFHWITAPKIPKSDRRSDVAVDYACSLHAIHLLAKVFEYRSGRAMFPVRVSRTVRIHAVSVSDYCLGFLSANRDRVPTTLASGLCKLVAVVAAFHGHEVIDSVAASEFGARILADVAERPDASRVAVGREHMADELFRANSRRRMDGAHADSLVRVATALSRRHEHVWRLVTRRMWFLEAAAAVCDVRSLMANVRCTPLGALTYHLDDGWRTDDVDWSDPRQKLLFGVACASGDRGRDWLNRHDAFASSNRFVEARLDEAETCLDPDDRKRLDAVVDVAYSYTCASVAGLTILLDDRGTTLAELYRLTYRRFDDNRFRVHRDVLVMLWLRLMEAATHTFSLRVYADSKLNYQDTLSALAAENRTEDGTVYVAETTRLLTKLRRGGGAVASPPAAVRENDAAVSLAVQVSSDAATRGAWTHGVRAAVVRAARISGTEMIDAIISYGRRRFDGRPEVPTGGDAIPTDFEAAGIRMALRYWSAVAGLPASEHSASELGRVYGSVVAGRGASRSFDCTVCTLFVACRGSAAECVEAYAVLRKLDERTRHVRPSGDAEDARAGFGHLVEGLLQRELPEVHNAFKMSGVSWWLLCSGWASDCFWGRLGWPEICRWLCLVAVFPADYQAFFYVCLAAARKRHWLEAFNAGRFREAVYQDDFGDFRLADHADYLDELARKHQRTVSKTLVSEFGTG